jgi:hypothetical protein
MPIPHANSIPQISFLLTLASMADSAAQINRLES